MEAEEKLREIYKREAEPVYSHFGQEDNETIHISYSGGVHIAAEHIDLIAELVVERLLADRISLTD